MLWTNTKRIVRTGFINFWRNGFVSLASIVVVTMSLVVFASLIFFNILMTEYVNQVKEKVDVNVYFTVSAPVEDILTLKRSLEGLPEVANVEYVSRDEALARFKEKHADDALTLQGLQELQENPLPAVLNVKAKEPSQYGSVAKFLESKNALGRDGTAIVESVNYNKNKIIIDKLVKIIDMSEKLGLGLSLILVFVSIVITFNTIRLVIYSAREEISVMRLVGASNKYIRGPFVVAGVMYGVISALITLALFYPITFYIGEFTRNFGAGVNLLHYYAINFGQIFLIIISSGILLGAISSYLAVRRYLNV
ncbi:MAG TPA: permease-like cell division protein FtsX [Candidatus Paceibacterota bacterium]